MNSTEVVAAVFGNTDDAAKAVDHVFAALAATYGAKWDRSLGTAPLSDTKTAWAFHLSNFTHSQTAKRRIMWALKNPLDTVPSPIDFRNLCRAAPAEAGALELPAPTQDPKVVAVIVSGIKGKAVVNGMKDWAHSLEARQIAGERLNPNQIRCKDAALRAA